MTKQEQKQIMTALLNTLVTQHKKIGQILADAQDTTKDKDPEYDARNLLLGTITGMDSDIENMKATYQVLVSMTKELPKE